MSYKFIYESYNMTHIIWIIYILPSLLSGLLELIIQYFEIWFSSSELHDLEVRLRWWWKIFRLLRRWRYTVKDLQKTILQLDWNCVQHRCDNGMLFVPNISALNKNNKKSVKLWYFIKWYDFKKWHNFEGTREIYPS